jgi:hypothetical protein
MSVDYRLQIVREMENGHFESVGYVHGGILCLKLAASLIQPCFKVGRLFSALFMPRFPFQEVAIRRLGFGACTLISHRKLDNQTFSVVR